MIAGDDAQSDLDRDSGLSKQPATVGVCMNLPSDSSANPL